MARTAWVLNLDAEDELRFGDAHTTKAATRARIAALTGRLRPLVGDDAVLVDPWDPTPGSAAGLPGQAWCPTPRALLCLEVAGAILPPAPSVAVLRRVNHRRFCSELGQTLPGATFVSSLDEARAVLAADSEGDGWLAKPALGFAGRGHLRLAAGGLDEASARSVATWIDVDGGIQLEPWVPRAGDFALHGCVAKGGSFRLGAPTTARVDERGTWRASALAEAGELSEAERDDLWKLTEQAARALAAVGYTGPFNTDAFRWRDRKNRLQFNARCELNARFSMGWALNARILIG